MSRSLVGSSSSRTFGSAEQQAQQLQPPPLAAGQVRHRRPLPVVREAEPLGQLATRTARRRRGWPCRGPPGSPRPPARRRAVRSTSCDRCAERTVWPIRTVPVAGCSSPASRRSRCVLPEPLTPMMPIRSPGPTCQVTWSSRVRSPTVTVTSSRSTTVRPRRRWASARSSTRRARRGDVGDQRLGRVDAELRLGRSRGRARAAARPVPCAAGSAAGPRPRPPAWPAPRARARTPRSRRRTGARSASPTSHVRAHTASRNHRSWVTTSSAPRRATR